MKFLIIIIIIVAFIAFAASTPCDNIRTRAQWGSRQTVVQDLEEVPRVIFIHHTAGWRCTTTAECDSAVKGMQIDHMDGKNAWADIGYNFLIGDTGQIYEGRGYGKLGVHTASNNYYSLGLSFIGNFTSDELPTHQALANAKAFITCSIGKGQLVENYCVSTHRDVVSTYCPGDAIHRNVSTWYRYNASPQQSCD